MRGNTMLATYRSKLPGFVPEFRLAADAALGKVLESDLGKRRVAQLKCDPDYSASRPSRFAAVANLKSLHTKCLTAGYSRDARSAAAS